MADKTTGNGSGSGATEPEIEIIEEGAPIVAAKETEQRGEGYDYPEGDDHDEPVMGDERVGHNAQGGETQADDGQGGTSAEKTARQRRRERERNARNAERAELIRLKTEVADLRNRVGTVDSRIANTELSGIDQQVESLESEIRKADSVMARAMAAQNGDDFVKAQNIRDVLRDRLNGLKVQKSQYEDGGDARGGQVTGRQAPQLAPEQVQFARIFAQRHPWYKHGSNDRDSQTVVQLDNEMTAQGLNPRTPEYWMELERRVREDMPHKFREAANEGGQRQSKVNNDSNNGQNGSGNSRPTGGPKLPGSGNSSGGGATGGGPMKFHLSAARKQALIDLGVYDDPVARMKHIKSFIEWDKSHQAK